MVGLVDDNVQQKTDETGLAQDDLTAEDKRSNVIPALADYKMPGLRGDILSADGVVYATTGTEKNLVRWAGPPPMRQRQMIKLYIGCGPVWMRCSRPLAWQ